MYQEYANMQGYNVLSVAPSAQATDGYDTCLTRLLAGLLRRPDHKEGLVCQYLAMLPPCDGQEYSAVGPFCFLARCCERHLNQTLVTCMPAMLRAGIILGIVCLCKISKTAYQKLM